MEKLFNWMSIVGGFAGGIFIRFLGGYDVILRAVLILTVLDYITGVIKGVYLKELSSDIGFKGILKKITVFIIIALSVVIEELTGSVAAIREIVIMFFICNEALSLLENAAVLVPVPEALKNILLQLRDKTGMDEKEDDSK